MRLVLVAAACLFAVGLTTEVSGRQGRLEVKSGSNPTGFTELLDRYYRGEPVQLPTDESVIELQRSLRRAGASWVGRRNAPDSARRRLTVATLALELVNQHLEERFWRSGFARDLIEWSCELLGETPPAAPERTWHLAALAQFERASAYRLSRGPVSQATRLTAFATHVAHAERRFPNDGRWEFARAVDAEHLVWPAAYDEDVLRPMPDVENRIRARLQAAFKYPAIAPEARVRWAYFHLRRARFAQALVELDSVGETSDSAVRYWHHFFRGHALAQLGRQNEAAAAYRVALAVFPNSQAATLSLASLLTRDGRITEGTELTSQMLSGQPADDPWDIYGFPTHRHWPAWIRELREAMTQ